DVERTKLCGRPTGIVDRHHQAALRARLTNVTALSVPAERDVRTVFAQRLTLVDVTQSPIVVTVSFQAVDGAGRIRIMLGRPTCGGVQYAEVEASLARGRVFGGHV